MPSLTVVLRGQVDGFRPDRSELRRHLQPQLVAVGPHILDGAQSLPGAPLQAGGAVAAHVLARPVPRLHHVTGQVSVPAAEIRNKMTAVSTLMLSGLCPGWLLFDRSGLCYHFNLFSCSFQILKSLNDATFKLRRTYFVSFSSITCAASPGFESGVHPLRAVPPTVHSIDVAVGFTADTDGSS